MAQVLITESIMADIAGAIRRKTAINEQLRPVDMAARIGTLHGYHSAAYDLPSDPAAIPTAVYTSTFSWTATAGEIEQ